MPEQKLKPCPFCGGKEIVVSGLSNSYGYCEMCDVYGPSGCNRKEAIEAWNRRVK